MGPRAWLGRRGSRPTAADVSRLVRRFPWRRLAMAAAAGVAVVLAVVGWQAWFSTRDDTERTDDALRLTRGELARTQSDLAAAVDRLDAARATLEDELATLDVRAEERDAAQTALDTSTAALQDRRSELDASAADLQSSTARLDALTRCVVGVSEALNQAAVGDTGGSTRTLGDVADICASAGATL